MSLFVRGREHLYIQELSETVVAIDQFSNHSRLSDRRMGVAYALQETLASLGLELEDSKLGIHRQLIIEGTNDLVRQNSYILAHAMGRIAREASLRRHPTDMRTPEERADRYTMHLQTILDHRIPGARSTVSFAFVVGGLIGGIAQEVAPLGAVIHLQDKTPWFATKEERKQYGLCIPKDITATERDRRQRNLDHLAHMHRKTAELRD